MGGKSSPSPPPVRLVTVQAVAVIQPSSPRYYFLFVQD
jgi:hypothetical protein